MKAVITKAKEEEVSEEALIQLFYLMMHPDSEVIVESEDVQLPPLSSRTLH
tara:strand:+ start:4324 stop:4476 length:153 start_codon:yes stop_codon:yes gene_type:complete